VSSGSLQHRKCVLLSFLPPLLAQNLVQTDFYGALDITLLLKHNMFQRVSALVKLHELTRNSRRRRPEEKEDIPREAGEGRHQAEAASSHALSSSFASVADCALP
jgi:hypothetical protein